MQALRIVKLYQRTNWAVYCSRFSSFFFSLFSVLALNVKHFAQNDLDCLLNVIKKKPAGGPGMNQITAKKIWVYFITIYTMRRTNNKNGSFL